MARQRLPSPQPGATQSLDRGNVRKWTLLDEPPCGRDDLRLHRCRILSYQQKNWVPLLLTFSFRRVKCFLMLLGLLMACSIASASSEERICPGTRAEVGSVADTDRAHVCGAAVAAESALAKCRISPRRPYTIRFFSDVRNPQGNCIFGQFRAGEKDVAAIVHLEASAALVASIPDGEPMSVYRKLPATELHHSLIVHEVSHAIVHQNLAVAPCHAVHEYIAAVAQISALSDESRRVYLEAFAGEDRYTTEMFNDIVLAMNPARYAAAAYRHFHLPENGCAFVRRLLADHNALPRLPN